MINKNEIDFLLKEFVKVENKIEEIKVLNKFDKASEYESRLSEIREEAKVIVLDNENSSKGFDETSLKVLSDLITLRATIDYYILKINDIIDNTEENKTDVQALESLKKSWNDLENNIKLWNESSHNPIEEIEHNKYIGRTTLDIIINQLKIEAIIDFFKIFKYCKKEILINAIKETLFDGAKEETNDEIRRHQITDLAKNLSEKDLYDYKLWQQILMIKNVRSRDDHIEMLGGMGEKEKKYNISPNNKPVVSENDEFIESSILKSLQKFFMNIGDKINQLNMKKRWATSDGPAFEITLENDKIIYSKEYIDKDIIERTKKLTVATNEITKYNFEKGYNWSNLEELEFLEDENISVVSLSSDKPYNCIGVETFANSPNLKNISFGKIELIGERAFKNCTNITELVFPKSLMNIGEDAFMGCTNLKKVVFLGNLQVYILKRPQNIINCFRKTNLEEITFANIDFAFDFAIIDCPNLKRISLLNVPNISIPFKKCKYIFGRQEGIVSFIGENSLNLWKKRNSTIRFYELTEEDKQKYNID